MNKNMKTVINIFIMLCVILFWVIFILSKSESLILK